ncbi:MAG: two-component sensor histidine kinase, partial [Deltaproteobacteria bacterium]|nr:two-component sensor histidine kinase [Deltaproteobacteria bacterium]
MDRQGHYQGLKGKILATMIFVPAIPFFLVLFIGYYHFTTSLEQSTISRMVRVVADHRQMIEMFLAERRADLQFMADGYAFSELSQSQNLEDIFANLQDKSPAFVDLGIFNQRGTLIAYQGPYRLTGKDYQSAEWFQEVMKQDYYISNIFLGYRRIPHFIIAIAKGAPGARWVVRATIDTFLFTDMVEQVRIGRTGEAYILNREGVFQTQRRSGGSLMEQDTDAIGRLEPHERTSTFVKEDIHKISYLYATAWLNDDKWLLVVRQEETDAFASLRSATYLVVLITILGGAGIIAMAFYMTNQVIRRMERADEDKNQLNQQLIVATRLAEIGEMSAGVAHEINNPLQIIKNEQALIQTILDEMRQKGELKESDDLAEVEDSISQIGLQVDRCGTITQGLLKFARQKENVVSEVDLRALVPEVTALVVNKASVDG